MKRHLPPLIVLAILLVGFAFQLKGDAQRLPGMVATHFDASGRPNQYMTRASHLKSMGFLGAGVTLAEALLFVGVRHLKGDRINIPNRAYWLAPERKEITLDAVLRWGLWLCCLTLLFFGIVEYVLVLANNVKPVHLDTVHIMGPALGFIACVLAWVAVLWLRFSRLPTTRG